METVGKQEKTKYKLAASMKECMKQMPVDKITVKNIVEGCGVARQTFYRNFLDKYDLINWYFDKLVLQSFEQIGMGHTVGESLTQKFEFIVDEKVFFTEAFRSDDRNSSVCAGCTGGKDQSAGAGEALPQLLRQGR